MKPRLSPTRVGNFLTCRMKYYWTYEEELTPKDKSIPLQVGDITHLLRHKYITNNLNLGDITNLEEMIREKYPNNTLEVSEEVTEQALKLIKCYINKASEMVITNVSSEMHVEVEEEEFFIYGRIDGLGRTQDQKLWRTETKTTARMDSLYLSGLKSGLQSGIYHYLLNKVLKEEIHGTIFELLVKTKTPYCELALVPISKPIMERALKAFEGVARSIKRGDFYPNPVKCVDYNRECDFIHLCNHPKQLEQIKQTFYVKRIKHN